MIIKCSKIRIFKYIIAVILFIAGISVTCELNIIEFQNKFGFFPYICFEEISDVQRLYKDIENLSSEKNVIVYTTEYDYSSLNCSATVLSVCGSETDKLKNKLGIQNNEFKSIFFNTVTVNICELNKKSMLGENTQFFIAGANDDIEGFVNSVKKQYKLSKLSLDEQKTNDTKILCYVLWIIIAAFIISLTLYEVALIKKEIFLKRIFGENLWCIHLKYNFSDSILLLIIFGLILLIIQKYTYLNFSLSYLRNMIIIICLINSLTYISLNLFDINIIIKDRFSEKALPYAYILGFVTSFLSVLSIIMAFSISETVENYTKMDRFVKSYSEYSICDFQRYIRYELNASNIYESKKKNEILNEEIYRKYFKKCEPVILAGLSINNGDTCIYANIHSYNYLCENIKEFANFKIESDIIIVVPKNVNNKESYIEAALNVIKNTEGDLFNFEYQVIEYEEDISILYISNTEETYLNIIDNPVVIYNSIKADTLTTPVSSTSRTSYNILYKMNDNIRNQIISEFHMENDICTITNLKDYYEHWYFIVSSTAKIVYSFCVSVIAAQIFVNISIISLSYKIDSKELALKKIMGYSLIEKNKKLIIYNFLSVLASVLLNIIITKSFSKVLICSVPIILVTIIVVVVQIKKSDKLNINNVLKGI